MTLNRILGPIAQVEIKDVLDRTKDDVYYNFNCLQVGSIVSYDSEKNIASVQLGMKRQLPTNEIIDYPVLEDCPVMYLTGGTSFISMPIEPGDTCMVLFNDRNIDTWWATGESNIPPTGRAHSLSDALVIVGVRNQSNVLTIKPSIVAINGGSNKIGIGNSSADLKVVLDELFDELTNSLVSWLESSLLPTLQGLTTDFGGAPLPLTAAAQTQLESLAPALVTLTNNLTATKTKLSQVLTEVQ